MAKLSNLAQFQMVGASHTLSTSTLHYSCLVSQGKGFLLFCEALIGYIASQRASLDHRVAMAKLRNLVQLKMAVPRTP